MPALTVQKLSMKQRKWIDEYLKTGNATEAAMRVYDCKNRDVARNIGTQNVAKLSFNDLMDGLGISDHKLLTKIDEGLSATRPVILGNKVAKVEDYQTRHKYVETSLKLKGRLKDKEDGTVINNTNNSLNLVFYGSSDPLKEIIKGESNNDSTQLQPVPIHDSGTE